uniref:cAMP-dependent protein kinase inhibitor beta n=1 Tax=Felis catus TaxID=9685 RepID=A0ABI7XEV6_FELCA
MRTDSSKMTDVEPVVNNFASSARTGRRNAVPDIQGSAGTGGISELPLRLEALSMEEDPKKKEREVLFHLQVLFKYKQSLFLGTLVFLHVE